MAQMIGADVEALRRMALQFEQSALRLRAISGNVSRGVRVSAWAGPVAVRFRVSWESEHSVRLKNAASALEGSALVLRQNADHQEAASASLAGAGGAMIGRELSSTPAGGLMAFDIGQPLGSWAHFVDGTYRAGAGLMGDALTWGDDALRHAKSGLLDHLRVLSPIARSFGKVLPVLGVGVGAIDIGSALVEGDGFALADGVVGTALTLGALALAPVAAPAAIVVGAVGLGWGAAQLISGDVPVSKRILDGASEASKTVSEGVKQVRRVVTDVADDVAAGVRHTTESAGRIADDIFSGPRRLLGL